VALHAFEQGTPQRLMGDLLGYWHREWRKHAADMITKLGDDASRLHDDPDAIVGLVFERHFERTTKAGKPSNPGIAFTFPAQPVGTALAPIGKPASASAVFMGPDGGLGFATVVGCVPEAGTLQLSWNPETRDLGIVPTALLLNDWVAPKPKPDALSALAALLLTGEATVPSVTLALLRNDPPRPREGGPAGVRFTDSIEDAKKWVLELDGTFVPIQGPPGTGKTWTGGHMIHALVKAGRRVGVTAMSHAAIDNLLSQTLEIFGKAGDLALLNGARHNASDSTPESPSLARPSSPKASANPKFNLVAGTTWFFANAEMRENPVDVLIIDEAGQLALADTVAATGAARNVVLLGDPSQLAQVASASHPDGSGASVLEHVLGEHATVPDDRGMFLSVTRRMHPDVCDFISSAFYEGRLASHPSCAVQSTAFGTGLRWLRAEHAGRSKESPEEALLVATQIAGMTGATWTDVEGTTRALTATDFMVVAPYNDQVRRIRAVLESDPRTRGVPVGTVDKFQGQEAAVVFFTMTTSTAADMPRDPRFLFSRSRLNLALSRARCLAYIVCTDGLLNSRATNLNDMRLISTVCAAVEYAGREKT
jgi:uncharacterized protein